MLLAIIADDLTGSLDASAPFAGRGLRTVAAVDSAHIGDALARAPDVLAINTASRDVSPEEARRRVSDALAQLPDGLRIFKKVDSRLKGNIVAELMAFPASRFSIVPAIPEFGRFVENGVMRGFGIEQPIIVEERLRALVGHIDIPDTATVEQMRSAVKQVKDDAVLVGARGAACALAESLAGSDSRSVSGCGKNLLMVIGSRDPITIRQISELRKACPNLIFLPAPNGRLEPSDGTPANRSGALTLVQAVEGDEPASEEEVALSLAQSLMDPRLEGRDGLLISGGATAETILKEGGIGVLDVQGEIVEGLPVSKAGDLTVISKSGGFGMPDALAVVARRYGIPVPDLL